MSISGNVESGSLIQSAEFLLQAYVEPFHGKIPESCYKTTVSAIRSYIEELRKNPLDREKAYEEIWKALAYTVDYDLRRHDIHGFIALDYLSYGKITILGKEENF